MGTAISTSVATAVQTAVNTTYQQAQNSCTTNCTQIQSGNVIVLDNSKAGNITFTQQCSAAASCYMTNALDATVTAYQNSNVGSGASPALFPGIQVNTTVSSNTQDIKNSLTQIMSNLCKSDVSQTITGNIVYATDSTLGNIGFIQGGNATASCVMENSGRLQLQMKQDGTTTAKAGGGISIGAGVIMLIVIVIIIIVIAGKLKKNTSDQNDPNKQNKNNPNGQNKNGIGTGNNRNGVQGGQRGATSTGRSSSAASSLKGARR